MDLGCLEIVATFFLLAAIAILPVVMVIGYRFNRRAYVNKRVDSKDQKQTAWRIFWAMLGFGVCMAIAGLSISLWSPVGLEQLTLQNALLTFLLCGGGSSLGATLAFLWLSTTAKTLYNKDANRNSE
jgi:uncharacterized membrane protein